MPEATIASYNVHWGHGPHRAGYPPFDVVEACRRLDADVLILQESWAPDRDRADHQRVADALGMVVACDVDLARAIVEPVPRVLSPASAGLRDGDGGWHLVGLSRHPVRDARVHPLPHLWFDHSDRAVLAFEIEVEGAPLHVRGTHLPHLEYGAHLSTRGLRRTLPPVTEPAVFAGDMNMWGWTIDRMMPRGWRREVRGKTWPARRPHSQIDHVLVTPSVQVLEGSVGPDLGSDHLPIRARLRWG
ncbi:MAG: endonuclease/exonuclease/phosphatase family protein [Microthrixaceae bacterium]